MPNSNHESRITGNGTGGWIILDKPSGMTSRRAGGIVARMFGIKKFGHLGTLDPMASGVLPIALGQATKMIPYLEGQKDERTKGQKEYEFSIKWGIKTDTDDITGNIIEQDSSICPFVPSCFSSALNSLIGEIEQTPPAYSAIHVNGRRAYELARAGKPVDIPPRRVKIYKLEEKKDEGRMMKDEKDTSSFCLHPSSFSVECSSGTYVRTLVQQIAEHARQIATCDMIRRTRTHGFKIKDAVSLDFLENLYNNSPASVTEYLKPIDFGLDDILVLKLDDSYAELFSNGGFVATTGDGLRRVYSENKFIGIGRIDNGILKPQRIIN
ncbi:MAG: tRNA pseudouridine(55) synthase TruB [Rickettsiales bacterium]|jgi:tRNA pseudouridine55 synthase|nr:tRNA pseudouridine(55) synthase TruB [Rickettsiales bacterium]